MIRGTIYRVIMRLAHRFNWHYAPPIYPENDKQLWCIVVAAYVLAYFLIDWLTDPGR